MLVAVTEREAHPHADIAIGRDDGLGVRGPCRDRARLHAAEMLHGRHSRRDQLEGRVERVEVRIGDAALEPVGQPQFERQVGCAELDGGHADVVMSVHQAGDDQAVLAPDHGHARMTGLDLGERADRCDAPVLLEHGAVVQGINPVVVDRLAKDVPSPDDRAPGRLDAWILATDHQLFLFFRPVLTTPGACSTAALPLVWHRCTSPVEERSHGHASSERRCARK